MARPTCTVGGGPTDGELMILRMLWEHGPGTARDLHDDLDAAGHPRAPTTIHRFLKIMTAKGLIDREGPLRPYRYRPVWSQAQIQQKLVSDLRDRVFLGDPAALAEALLATPLTDDHLAAIRQALDARLQRRAEARNAPSEDAGPRFF
ncbi:MAG: BlaI/MecI/CopY family transcriptional regulator [Planctomycetota bacterium]